MCALQIAAATGDAGREGHEGAAGKGGWVRQLKGSEKRTGREEEAEEEEGRGVATRWTLSTRMNEWAAGSSGVLLQRGAAAFPARRVAS